MSQEDATSLKTLTIGSANQAFPSGWVNQSFKFQPPHVSRDGEKHLTEGCPFGLVQKKGGPCGILAAVQAYIIKVLIHK